MLRVVDGYMGYEEWRKVAENCYIVFDWVPGWTDGTWVSQLQLTDYAWRMFFGECQLYDFKGI